MIEPLQCQFDGRWVRMAMTRWRLTILSCLLCLSSWSQAAVGAEATPPPTVDLTSLRRIGPHVLVASDRRIPLVPNIGIIEGRKAILVVDTGLGPANGKRVFAAVRQLAEGRKIYLTTTHFHPEHSFGASAFPAEHFIINSRQADELAEKGPGYLGRFRAIGPDAKEALTDTIIAEPGIIYRERYEIDLGGVKVELHETPAHTRGDQVIFVPGSRILFTGDLAETRFFPVLIDQDSHGSRWISVLSQLAALQPAIIVPGHGETTDGRLLLDVRAMLEWMRSEVREKVARDEPLETLVADVQIAARARYPTWSNGEYLRYDIVAFRTEALAERERSAPRLDNLSQPAAAKGH